MILRSLRRGMFMAAERSFLERVLFEPLLLIKRTFQPSLVRRKRKWGFLARLRDKDGRKILARRRHKGRARLSM